MNSRERLTRLFNRQDLDRMPIWLLAPYHKLSYYADIYDIRCYRKITEYIDLYCDTFDRRVFDTGFCYNGNPEIAKSIVNSVEGGNSILSETIRYKDLSLKKTISRGQDGTHLKHFIDEIDTLEKLLEIPYSPVKPDISKYLKEKEALGDKGIMMIDIGDPLVPLYYLMSAENFSLFTLTDYDKILNFTDEMYKRVYKLYKYLLEEDIGEVFFIVGAEFAGPPLVNPEKFNEMCVRYIKGICDLIREYGKWSIVHYHGNLYKVLGGMKAIRPDGLHTIEAPPVGDCTISQARDVLGKDTILIGNIQYDDLVHRQKEEIDEMVRNVLEEGRSGRFILSPTAGPYETTPSEKTIENYLTFIEAGIKYGRL